jgi:hypothetical protein
VIRVRFPVSRTDHTKLEYEDEVNVMGQIQLSRGRPTAASRCPECDGPYDVAVRGTGWATCPHCDTRLHFESDGEVTVGTVIAASATYGLTPMERRIAKQVGVTLEEAWHAKKLYG